MTPGQQLIVVSCYTRFDNLAHGPRGTESANSLYTFRMDPSDGQMVLLSKTVEPVMNSAFSRFHPKKNILYTCTESVAEDGEIVSWKVCPKTGQVSQLAKQGAGGSSTCYLLLDKESENMLVVNYWDATIGVFGINQESGAVDTMLSVYDPKEGRPMKARPDKHVNHSRNDSNAQKERQSDPHSHAVILDPYFGRIAYVPDLGMDLIRQFLYDKETGKLTPLGSQPSGPPGRVALGPRYIEFHPTLPICYVINELSSEVSVFEFDSTVAGNLVNDKNARPEPTLKLLQTVRTIPEGFPGEMNTCGRICVHKGGNFVLVSNRGHNSVTVLRVHNELPCPGLLSVASISHTRGATPRHFQFDGSGQWLVTANQDSDSIAVFHFNHATGKLHWTGHKYHVPSPNFVCSVRPHAEVETRPSKAQRGHQRVPQGDASQQQPVAVAVSSKL